MCFPDDVDDGLMREDSIGAYRGRPRERDGEQASDQQTEAIELSLHHSNWAKKISRQLPVQKENKPAAHRLRRGWA
jgi:hypothetical protein